MKDAKIIKKDSGCIAMIKSNDWLIIPEKGWGNGYVAIPKTHKLYGIGYMDIHEKYDIDVHYGLTYSAESEEFDNMWVFGFDTVHLNDNQYNWPEEKVIAETIKLMNQLIKIGN